MTAMLTSGLHVNTVRQRLHAVKPFYRWCWQRRIVDAELLMRIHEVEPPRGSTGKARRRPYKRTEVQRLWQQLDGRWPLPEERFIARYQRGTPPYRRIWRHAMHLQIEAVATLALFGGLRQTEIRLATIDGIYPDNEFIVVPGMSPFGEREGYREVPRYILPRGSSRRTCRKDVARRSSRPACAHNACSARAGVDDAGRDS